MGADFYHQWWYVYVLNTRGFVWTMSILVFGVNILGPVLLWAVFRGKPLWNDGQRQLLTSFLAGGSTRSTNATSSGEQDKSSGANE